MKMKIRTTRKRLLSVLLAVAMVLTALPLTALPALAATSGDFEYAVLSEADKTCAITGYTGSATVLTIPSELDGYTVTSIGRYAFSGCTALKSITIPNSVIEIRMGAFQACYSLTDIFIPASVKVIESSIFTRCFSLKNIFVSEQNTDFSATNSVLFNKDQTILLEYSPGKTEEVYTVPSTVKKIGAWAFRGARGCLSSVIIPDNVIEIGAYAFFELNGLSYVSIGNGVTHIREGAFIYCENLSSVSLGEHIECIENEAFSNCRNLQKIIIPNSVIEIGKNAFSSCGLTDVEIGKGVTKLSAELFYDCNDLVHIVIPGNVKTIEKNAFGSCDYLESVHIENGVSTIGTSAFSKCVRLKSIIIPNTVNTIDDYAFFSCNALNEVTICDGVKNIGNGAFEQCAALESIIFPNSVKTIGYAAFNNCTSLKTIEITDNVEHIGGGAFNNTVFYNNIENWENSALYIGHHLVDAKDNIVGEYVVRSGTKTLAKQIFSYFVMGLTSVILPEGILCIDDYSFENSGSLSKITIPESINHISDSAFQGSGLQTIYGYAESYAETYAYTHGYTFVALQKLTDSTTGISVNEGRFENLPSGTFLNVVKLSAKENTITYDITLTVNDEIVQPASAVTVKIPVPAGMDGTQCKVYREETNGKMTDMQATYQNGYMVFTTDHFSIYMVTTEELDTPSYTLGDVNGDKKINAVDARWVLQAASGARVFDATQTAAADVNGDGKVNAVDARWILQVASGARTL